MGLVDIINKAIAGPITKIAGPLRAELLHTPITGSSVSGPTYGSPVPRKALIEYGSEQVASLDGTVHVSNAHFTFFEKFTLTEGDILTLNGRDMTVVKVAGLLDPNGVPYLPEAYTGQ